MEQMFGRLECLTGIQESSAANVSEGKPQDEVDIDENGSTAGNADSSNGSADSDGGSVGGSAANVDADADAKVNANANNAADGNGEASGRFLRRRRQSADPDAQRDESGGAEVSVDDYFELVGFGIQILAIR